ncbi:MAG TPA: hypothetical protein VKF38_13475 [Anaerolineaceae bacterium]|nr:hypothetical protein [Anaerolineaceae bacterium]
MKNLLGKLAAFALTIVLAVTATPVFAASSFLGSLNTNKTIASTVPSNGDVNPYGVAVVKYSTGNLVKGDILVSNFNNKSNLQGTGTTIVQVSPSGHVSLFAHISASNLPGSCPGGIGLTTALVVLNEGWVVVGSLPTKDGTAATAKAGCLLVLNNHGHVVETISGTGVNGPWDMTAVENGVTVALFVTNVLNGTVAASPKVVHTATIERIMLTLHGSDKPNIQSRTVIGSGFGARTDPSALVIGPTGVGLNSNGTLFVADTLANRIAAIPNAFSRMSDDHTGQTILTGHALNGPLGLTIAPDGHIIVANSNDGNMVEVTTSGNQVAFKNVDLTGTGGGTLFGLAITPDGKGIYYVNDGNNMLDVLK